MASVKKEKTYAERKRGKNPPIIQEKRSMARARRQDR